MKKVILTLVFLMVAQINFASVEDSLLVKARAYSTNADYTLAVKSYKEYLNHTTEKKLKNVYVELANCYYKLDDKKNAVNTLKDAITKYGFNEQDFIYNQVIDREFSDYALSIVYDDLDKLHNKYLATLD